MPPPDRCTRTLLVGLPAAWAAPIEPGRRSGGRHRPPPPAPASPGLTAFNFRQRLVFALEGSVPPWRWAIGDALLEKRFRMTAGAHTTTGLDPRLQGRAPLRLEIELLVNARCDHGGGGPELRDSAYPQARAR